jgi:hypothetical protein
VKNIRRATRRHFSAEDKIRIVLEGLRERIFGGVFLIWRRPERSWSSSTEKFCNPNGQDADAQ